MLEISEKSPEWIVQHLQAILVDLALGDLYHRLNQARDWFNASVSGFEIYLEDEWNVYAEGQTYFDYCLRSLETKDELPPLASDIYLNHQDAGGVWHLGAYQSSYLRIDDWNHVLYFLKYHRSLP
jgi:hypothetical protein